MNAKFRVSVAIFDKMAQAFVHKDFSSILVHNDAICQAVNCNISCAGANAMISLMLVIPTSLHLLLAFIIMESVQRDSWQKQH